MADEPDKDSKTEEPTEKKFSPSAWALLRLITRSNTVGCSIGRSAGLAPFRILST